MPRATEASDYLSVQALPTKLVASRGDALGPTRPALLQRFRVASSADAAQES